MTPEPLIFVAADWPAPASVRACVTTRAGGCSLAPWESLNLAMHVGDEPRSVQRNRERVAMQLRLPCTPQWLEQVHGSTVVDARDDGATRLGDAVYTDLPGIVCAVLTADCLPVMLCDRDGCEVAVVHCGWRGLAAGVLRAAVARFRASGDAVIAWLGPAIAQQAFEVGAEVREHFLDAARDDLRHAGVNAAFVPAPGRPGKFHADLYALARSELATIGVTAVYGGGFCTHSEPSRFFSYRRDGRTGRMASLIWISD